MGHKILNKLERKFSYLAIHNITMHIIGAQVLFWILIRTGYINPESMLLNGPKVLQGEVWRLLTFLCMPPATSIIFIIFAWLIFNMMGNSLEEHWGTFKYNAYLFVGYIATIAVCLIPALFIDNGYLAYYQVSNMYFTSSIFFAFAFLFPNVEFMIMFILPVKVKWLALISGAIYLISFFTGTWMTKLLIFGGTLNFFLFFGKEFFLSLKTKKRRKSFQKKENSIEAKAFHTCAHCGITDKSHPEMTFRYCSACGKGFCGEHINEHGCEK